MIKIKRDLYFESTAERIGMASDVFAESIETFADLDDGKCDEYAGETLGRLLSDQPMRHKSLTMLFNLDQIDEIGDLFLFYYGDVELPCPRCGWDMAPQEEGKFIVGYKCPHCGYSQLELPEDA
jgi:hypothetical protein